MSASLLQAVLAVLAIPLAGYPAARALHLPGPLLFAASFLLGAGMLSFAMLVASIVGIGWGRLQLGLAWCLVVALGALLQRALPGSRPGAGLKFTWKMPAVDPAVAFLLAVCVFQTAFVWLQAVRVPLGSFDAWSLWEYKGRRFWIDGGVTSSFLHDGAVIFAHPAYPPLVPLLIAWIYTWAGAADPSLMKPLFPLFYASLLVAFYAAVRPRVGALYALVAVAALALLPHMAEYAGTGLADVPLAAALVAAAAAYVNARETHSARGILAAGLLLGLAMCTKREGVLFFISAMLAVGAIERSWRRLCAVALPAAVVGTPWYVYVALTGVPDRDFLSTSVAQLHAHADRLGPIARLFTLNLLAVDEWSVLWYAFGAVLLLACMRQRIRAAALLAPILLPLCAYIVSLSLSAWPDYMLHVRTSLDRLILVTTPFALWFVVEQLVPRRAQVEIPR